MRDVKEIYREYVYERQSTFDNKLINPKYVSPLLQHYKFTNNHRILDRVNQYELQNVIYSETLSQSSVDVVKRIFLFNQFKTIAFWEGCKNLSFDDIPKYTESNTDSRKIFTSAYLVPGKKGEPKAATIMKRCRLLESYTTELTRAVNLKRIDIIFNVLLEIPGIGDFLASQVCFDFLWHECTKGWEHLYILGVGAKRGVKKLGLEGNERGVIQQAMDIITSGRYPYLIVDSKPLPLFPADIQNTFCEIDKYLRLVRPDLNLGNTRIKNKYTPHDAIKYKVPAFMIGGNDGLMDIN